ncbi:hypothetical protein W02_24620 [Nitrospira sp. KM1]|uniref:tyrosine-type recombinase/integrase n=1 Tax=Nitrospira sp. KM1 TaxID=1936990 RepID=UPI0013A72B82|nr:site-specific integrase [Nitrospira sp. KM1]BCA55322.1 hypothetical protein W02_24620 [Nitrospira sp. KM1]
MAPNFTLVPSSAVPALNSIVEDYEAECLAGRRFPDPDDHELWQRCKETWRIREWIELYYRYHLSTLADSTTTVIKARIGKHFTPLLDLKPESITRRWIIHWSDEIAKTSPVVAYMCIKNLKALFFKAAEWEIWDKANPTRGIKRPRPFPRTRFIQPGEELQRLMTVLNMEPDDIKTFFITLLLTGCRKGEAQRMKWADLDLVNGLWHKPAGTTKAKRPQTTPLPAQLVKLLTWLPRLSTYVFERPDQLGRWGEIYTQNQWARIRKRAHLPDCRIHDIRRTFASFMAMNGKSSTLIANALGHANLSQVHIYARLDVSSLRTAVDEQAESIMRLYPDLTPPDRHDGSGARSQPPKPPRRPAPHAKTVRPEPVHVEPEPIPAEAVVVQPTYVHPEPVSQDEWPG